MDYIYIAFGLVAGYFLFKKFLISRQDYKKILQEGAIIIDVRSPQEYDQGHISESINIPLGNINARSADLQARKVPIILCCASGMRSGQAAGMLKSKGITCYNGGNWKVLQANINK
jgi:phage shock protein E